MNYKRLLSPKSVFFFCSFSGIFLFGIIALVKGPIMLEWLAMENDTGWGMLDYFRHVYFTLDREQLYFQSNDACFPPLAYLFYYFIRRVTIQNGTNISSYFVMPTLPYQMMVFLLYTVIGVVLLVYAIGELKIKEYEKKLLSISVFFSTPMFAGAIERGNMLLYVIAILLLAMAWKDSDKPVKRELALILIAIAAGLKIYPCFTGIIYLKEKRFAEAGRLIIYGLIMFFVPFVFFGGIDGFFGLMDLLMGRLNIDYTGRVQFFMGILGNIGIKGKVAYYANYIFLLCLLIAVLLTKSNIREMTFLAAAMAFFPAEAHRYTLLYFLLPLSVLFVEREKDNSIDCYINAVFLGLLYSIPTVFGIITHFELNYDIYTKTYVEVYIYTIAWCYLLYQFVIEIISKCNIGVAKTKSC